MRNRSVPFRSPLMITILVSLLFTKNVSQLSWLQVREPNLSFSYSWTCYVWCGNNYTGFSRHHKWGRTKAPEGLYFGSKKLVEKQDILLLYGLYIIDIQLRHNKQITWQSNQQYHCVITNYKQVDNSIKQT